MKLNIKASTYTKNLRLKEWILETWSLYNLPRCPISRPMSSKRDRNSASKSWWTTTTYSFPIDELEWNIQQIEKRYSKPAFSSFNGLHHDMSLNCLMNHTMNFLRWWTAARHLKAAESGENILCPTAVYFELAPIAELRWSWTIQRISFAISSRNKLLQLMIHRWPQQETKQSATAPYLTLHSSRKWTVWGLGLI